MKVNIAAQVLSNTVAHQLEKEYGDKVAGTVQFIRHMNHFFDCLNTRNLFEAEHKRDANREAYKDANDDRLKYLEGEFLQYAQNTL